MDFLWVIIVFAIVVSLPDLLRRKRRYPTRRNPKPGPTGESSPSPDKKSTDLEKEQPPVFTKTQQEQPAEQSIPVPTYKKIPVPQELPAQPMHISQGMPETISAAVNTISQPVPSQSLWSQLPPQAQQIYAGLIWSEILQPPLSRRKRY
ncbi:hypothetical protein NXG27_02060 [Megasphaera paucivorans]|uniref:Uncharacterized protein n=1 Tax=Megasphaera paucivorans TaxID=349095 RepID=A0A1G9T2Y3_9FIRM|nr:hypothetical protein [Megasphaera paucivorans]SDM42104.1 hypothetical protein SAMN05660299_00856 [Megasphaera paucivorans]